MKKPRKIVSVESLTTRLPDRDGTLDSFMNDTSSPERMAFCLFNNSHLIETFLFRLIQKRSKKLEKDPTRKIKIPALLIEGKTMFPHLAKKKFALAKTSADIFGKGDILVSVKSRLVRLNTLSITFDIPIVLLENKLNTTARTLNLIMKDTEHKFQIVRTTDGLEKLGFTLI